MQERLRRYRNEMAVFGIGVFAFGIWSLLRTGIYIAMVPEEFVIKGWASASLIVKILTVLIIAAILCFEIGLRVIVFLSARSESKNGKRRYLYIVITVIMILVSLLSVAFSAMAYGEASVYSILAALIFEISSIYVMVRLLIAVFAARRLSGKD